MTGQAIEIARQEGRQFRSVRLSLGDDGAIRMDAQDIASGGSQIWGDDEGDEYEFWVHVPPAAVAALAFELLREKFAGRLDAVDAFRDWCKARGLAHEFGSWV